jgi:hypothetical protein
MGVVVSGSALACVHVEQGVLLVVVVGTSGRRTGHLPQRHRSAPPVYRQ